MENKTKILIIEPAVIVQEGISRIIASIDAKIITICVDSLNDSFKLSLDESFRIVLVNPLLFNNNRVNLSKFSAHFEEFNHLGLISNYFTKSLSSAFSDCIYLNDDKASIINTITKFLSSKSHNQISSKNLLSEREIDVLKLLTKGKSHKEIAEVLYLSIHTVSTHRKNISIKLGIKSSAALAIYAVANNYIDVNDSLKSTI